MLFEPGHQALSVEDVVAWHFIYYAVGAVARRRAIFLTTLLDLIIRVFHLAFNLITKFLLFAILFFSGVVILEAVGDWREADAALYFRRLEIYHSVLL